MARAAPFFPIAKTGDGVATVFALGFPILSQDHVRVIKNSVLMVLGTDYTIQDPQLDPANGVGPTVRFLAVPTNGHAIKFYRNTPIAPESVKLMMGPRTALYTLFRHQERADGRIRLDYFFNQVDLLAPTAQSIVAPCDGYIEKMWTTVEKAVTTGGVITVEVDTVAVTGLSVTVADADAAGTVYNDTPTTPQSTTTKVKRGQTITVSPGAPFATAGVVSGYLEFQQADL